MRRCATRSYRTGEFTGRWFDFDRAKPVARRLIHPLVHDDEDPIELRKTEFGSYVIATAPSFGDPKYFEVSVEEAAVWCVQSNVDSDDLPPDLTQALDELRI